jgi:hypothetical protein
MVDISQTSKRGTVILLPHGTNYKPAALVANQKSKRQVANEQLCPNVVRWACRSPSSAGGSAMTSIDEVLAPFKQTMHFWLNDLKVFLSPSAAMLADHRHEHSLLQFVSGMLAARSSQVSQAAAHVPAHAARSWSLAKCIYLSVLSRYRIVRL